ncbi:MAG TPA: ECF-type sigma factor [Xanthomonadaceae bacterium]|nr:ECF-type sigma factor [Xanthomonadaceae bacterium]
MDTNDATFDRLLTAYRDGDAGALDGLVPLVYEDLRRIARRQARAGRGLTIDTTALVHEAYLKMADQSRLDARDRGHLLAICARAMRQFMVSHARERQADKRGGGARQTTLGNALVSSEAEADQLILVDQALERLGMLDERLVKVFECRYFAGLSEQETAEALDQSLRTVQRDWMRARAWLREWLEADR